MHEYHYLVWIVVGIVAGFGAVCIGFGVDWVWENLKRQMRPIDITQRIACGANESVYLMNMGNGWPNRPQWVGRWRGVRTERYTYARWFQHERGPWLFDRHEDPLETRNIFGTAEARPAVEEMETRLHRWMEATGDPFEYGKRGPRGFLDVGQRWANPKLYKGWATA